MSANQDLLSAIAWDERGLLPVIAQDHASGRVLMMAWMDRLALEQTLATGEAVYYSRSRARPWKKGEQSGHVQKVRELRLDCDGDTLLISVEQVGGIACHTGHERCFFRNFDDNGWVESEPVLKQPKDIYK